MSRTTAELEQVRLASAEAKATGESRCPHCGVDLAPFRRAMNESLAFCAKCTFPLSLIAGKYRLVRVLGDRGHRILYKAVHLGATKERERVIEIIKPKLGLFRSFEQSVEDLSSISASHTHEAHLRETLFAQVQRLGQASQQSRHIVRVFEDFGVLPNLGYFYVMEYLRGTPLRLSLSEPESLPSVSWCVSVFQQLCEAMEVLHKNQILHRDLRPEHILLVRERGSSDFLKLLDFGLGHPFRWDTAPTSEHVRPSLSSPLYTSPEECAHHEPDLRSDIYTMGVILFQMLTGHHPFVPPAQEGQVSMMGILYAHLMNPPPSLRELRPDREIPKAVEDVVLRALAKKPEARFPSAGQFWRELRRALGVPRQNSRESFGIFSREPTDAFMALSSQVTLRAATPEAQVSLTHPSANDMSIKRGDTEQHIVAPRSLRREWIRTGVEDTIELLLPLSFAADEAQKKEQALGVEMGPTHRVDGTYGAKKQTDMALVQKDEAVFLAKDTGVVSSAWQSKVEESHLLPTPEEFWSGEHLLSTGLSPALPQSRWMLSIPLIFAILLLAWVLWGLGEHRGYFGKEHVCQDGGQLRCFAPRRVAARPPGSRPHRPSSAPSL